MADTHKLVIGLKTFELAPIADAHAVEEQVLGEDGPFDYHMEDWGGGLLPSTIGIKEDGTPRYVSAKGLDGSFPGQIVCQPQATTLAIGGTALTAGARVLKQVDFGGFAIFAFEGDRRIRRYSVGGGWADALDLGVGNEAKDLIVQGGYVIVAYGAAGAAGTAYQYSTNGTAWTNVATAADRFGVLSQKLWRVVRPNSTFSANDPTAAWTASSVVGDSGFNINSLTSMEQLLLIGKEDGIWSIDVDGIVYPLTPELRLLADANMAALRAQTVFNGEYYFRTAAGLILMGVDASKSREGLDQLSSPDLPTTKIKALAQDDRFLYALCDNDAAGLMILRRTIAGAWHVFYWEAAGGRGQHLGVSNILGYPALFFSYTAFPDTGAVTLKSIRLAAFANPRQDANYLYDVPAAGVSWLRGPRFGSARQKLTLDRVVFQAEGLNANRTVQLYLATDGAAPAAFGSAATQSPTQEIQGGPVTGNFFDPYLYLANNAAAGTPILAGFAVQGVKRPSRRLAHHFTVVAAHGAPAQRGGMLSRFPNKVFDDLKTLRDGNTFSAIKDENGRTFQGLVTDLRRTLVSLKDKPPAHGVSVGIVEQWTP